MVAWWHGGRIALLDSTVRTGKYPRAVCLYSYREYMYVLIPVPVQVRYKYRVVVQVRYEYVYRKYMYDEYWAVMVRLTGYLYCSFSYE